MYPSSCSFQFQYRSQNQLVAVTVILFERKQENGYFNYLISLTSSIFSESQDSNLIYVIVEVLIKKTTLYRMSRKEIFEWIFKRYDSRSLIILFVSPLSLFFSSSIFHNVVGIEEVTTSGQGDDWQRLPLTTKRFLLMEWLLLACLRSS